MYPTGSRQKYNWSTAGKNTLLKSVNFMSERFAVYVQWLAKKLAISISVIRKLAVVFIPVEIQKFV